MAKLAVTLFQGVQEMFEPTGEVPWFKKQTETRDWYAAYEPQLLWLIPVQLRTRARYYDDHANEFIRNLESSRQAQEAVRMSVPDHPWFPYRSAAEVEEMENASWRAATPQWWGLNDIVGYIDVRVCARERELQVALFLTTKRLYRFLRIKEPFVFRRQETASLTGLETNEELQATSVSLIQKVRSDARIGRCHVDIDGWNRVIRHTDLRRLFAEVGQDYARLGEEETKPKA